MPWLEAGVLCLTYYWHLSCRVWEDPVFSHEAALERSRVIPPEGQERKALRGQVGGLSCCAIHAFSELPAP